MSSFFRTQCTSATGVKLVIDFPCLRAVLGYTGDQHGPWTRVSFFGTRVHGMCDPFSRAVSTAVNKGVILDTSCSLAVHPLTRV